MRKYRDYTDEDIIKSAAVVTSLAQLLVKLNLKTVGGNYANMRRNLQRLNIDTSHWTGNGWNKGKRLKDWTRYTRSSNLKPHLIEERGHKCERCSRDTWMDVKIKLEVHHLDGNKTNNNIDNLMLLCPNCHSITDNWRKPNF